MGQVTEPAICEFYRLIEGAPAPRRADRSADGSLPVVAYRYCEPVAAASAFGWYLFPPINFALIWDGREVAWTREGAEGWLPVRAEPYPGFAKKFGRLAPPDMSDLMPPFLSQGRLPGLVQIWSGFVATTAPGWSLLSRGVANRDPIQSYENHDTLIECVPDEDTIPSVTPPFSNYEGIIETDTWFGPLITNIRLLRINSPVMFHMTSPLFQVQPLLRQCYHEPSYAVFDHTSLTPSHWQRFEATMRPNADHMRRPGHYAAKTRKRLRQPERVS